jgi:hypothetical protein
VYLGALRRQPIDNDDPDFRSPNSHPQAPPEGPKPKRAARTNLNAYTAEQKQERRKERARVYSAIARERQENNMKELKLRVESLTVYKVGGWVEIGTAV